MMKNKLVISVLAAVAFVALAPTTWATGLENIAPMSIIPEPATGALLAIGGLMVLPRRKKD